MKNIFIVLITFSLLGCAETPKETPVNKTEEVRISKFKELLKKYKEISFDTLEVFAVFDMEKKSYKYSGIELDSTEMQLMPDIGTKAPQSFFACYQFMMDSANVGLITRAPGEYSATSIKLLVLDTKLDSIVSYFELSDLSGDAGDMWQKTSWLYKNGDRQYRSLLWQELTHDRSVDDEPDSTIDRTNNYYLIDFSSLKADTISADTAKLTAQFGHLLINKTPNE